MDGKNSQYRSRHTNTDVIGIPAALQCRGQ